MGTIEADQIGFLDFSTERERGFATMIFPVAYRAKAQVKATTVALLKVQPPK